MSVYISGHVYRERVPFADLPLKGRADWSFLPFEDEERACNDESEAYGMIPGDALAQIERGEDAEDCEGDDFLYSLQLGSGEIAEAYAVGGNLKAVFEEGYAPAQDYGSYPCKRMVAQVAVPRIRHEDIGADEQNDRA